jgi:hypothetical protein
VLVGSAQHFDPRDCVVSLFFSWAYSHVAPGGDKKQAFMELREQTRTKDINDFVLERARDFADMLDSIQLVADRYPSAFVSRYEDMLTEFEPWLNKVQAFLGLVSRNPQFNKSGPVPRSVSRKRTSADTCGR